MRYRHDIYDIPALAESEFALAISPCPRIDQSGDAAQAAGVAYELPESGGRHTAKRLAQMDNEFHDPAQSLSFGWTIALAAVAAFIIFVSGS